MGSLLSSVIAFSIKDFEEVALSSAICKPICWFHGIDNIFVIWPHAPEKLNDFLSHRSIQFIIYSESDDHLPEQ